MKIFFFAALLFIMTAAVATAQQSPENIVPTQTAVKNGKTFGETSIAPSFHLHFGMNCFANGVGYGGGKGSYLMVRDGKDVAIFFQPFTGWVHNGWVRVHTMKNTFLQTLNAQLTDDNSLIINGTTLIQRVDATSFTVNQYPESMFVSN